LQVAEFICRNGSAASCRVLQEPTTWPSLKRQSASPEPKRGGLGSLRTQNSRGPAQAIRAVSPGPPQTVLSWCQLWPFQL
jgi:hypothetical protein